MTHAQRPREPPREGLPATRCTAACFGILDVGISSITASLRYSPQVLGYKYVRIYGSDQTHRVYPLEGERCNTSRIDLDAFERALEAGAGAGRGTGVGAGRKAGREASAGARQEAPVDSHRNGAEKSGEAHADEQGPDRFPLFEEAPFWQGVLGPGDGLYIPRHAWHYVRSLTPSFSVSFWWGARMGLVRVDGESRHEAGAKAAVGRGAAVVPNGDEAAHPHPHPRFQAVY